MDLAATLYSLAIRAVVSGRIGLKQHTDPLSSCSLYYLAIFFKNKQDAPQKERKDRSV